MDASGLTFGITLAVLAAGHLLYLGALALSVDLLDTLPAATRAETDASYPPPPLSATDLVRRIVPWNLPALALAIHALVAAGVLAYASRCAATPDTGKAHGQNRTGSSSPFAPRFSVACPHDAKRRVGMSCGRANILGRGCAA